MQGIRKANRQLRGEVNALKSLLERLKSADDDAKADIMARLADDEPPEAILQRLKDGEGVSRKGKPGSSHIHTTSETEPFRRSPTTTTTTTTTTMTSTTTLKPTRATSIDGLVKVEEDDEPPLPPGIVPWHIDKMHYLLHRVQRIDINANSTDSQVCIPLRQSEKLLGSNPRPRGPTPFQVLLGRVPAPGAVEAFGNLPLSSAVRANYYPAAVQARQLLALQTEEYRLPSFIASDGSPLSSLFYSYRDAAMEMLSNGVPASQVLGPSDRIDLELFFREREPHDAYDVHSWSCELLKNIEGYDIFVKLASVALYTTYMRWNILPTATNYALMPAMIRPTQLQRFVPHRMTIDLVPHPAIRDALIHKFRDWLSPGTTDTGGTSVGWPYSLDAAVDVCPITGRRMLSRAFIEHATNGSNWSLDKSIRAMYPEIEGMGFRIRE
ncbi:BZIP transcription factor [Colletotrichum higginsianum]|nr:BZIP transcription factor [Colletotrichum higginsianum]